MSKSPDERQVQLRRGILELGVLVLLERGPSYGYEVVSRLGAFPPFAAGEGTVYPLLRRLRAEGTVTTYWQSSTAGPPRQYYRLTRDGKRRLADLVAEWKDVASSMDALMNGADTP